MCIRDRHQDVLLFIDNIFRFTQAGSEVSALLGRMPSAVGYQPTLATEMGALQERITSTRKGSITSVQAVYVPADDLTDPAPATTLSLIHIWMCIRDRYYFKRRGLYGFYDDGERFAFFSRAILEMLFYTCLLYTSRCV